MLYTEKNNTDVKSAWYSCEPRLLSHVPQRWQSVVTRCALPRPTPVLLNLPQEKLIPNHFLTAGSSHCAELYVLIFAMQDSKGIKLVRSNLSLSVTESLPWLVFSLRELDSILSLFISESIMQAPLRLILQCLTCTNWHALLSVLSLNVWT